MNITTYNEFEEKILKSTIPVIIDFWAEWCGPCKVLTPVLAELEEQLADKIAIYKANVDEATELATKFNIRSIPTLILFNGGGEIDRKVGALAKDKILEWINKIL